MDKKNLFPIGEIAKAVGVTRKNILNYEVKGLINLSIFKIYVRPL